MSKITLNQIGSITQSPTTAQTLINFNSDIIQTAMDNTISRDGTGPNTMQAPLDMNSKQIINLPAPLTANSPARLQDLDTLNGGGTITNIPAGGTINTFLAKNSNSDFDVKWAPVSVNMTAGTNISITGTTNTTIATIATPAFTTVGVNGNTITSAPSSGILVGTTDTQVLTNKTLTAPTLNSATINSPTFTTPVLGVATATSINKVTITAPATGAILTIPDGVTLTGPATSGTAMTLGNSEIVTGTKTFGAAGNVGKLAIAGTTSGSTVLNATAVASGTLTLPAATDTLVGKATTDILTNKTLTSPTLTTPVLGTPSSGTLTSCTGLPLTTGVTGILPFANGGTNDAGTAWSTYTPTIGAGTGTITTSSATGRYKQLGKTVFLEMSITITTNGTGATFVTATLPGGFTCVADTFFGGKARAVSGKLIGASVTATGNTLAIANYDNTYPGSNGEILVISGVFEAT